MWFPTAADSGAQKLVLVLEKLEDANIPTFPQIIQMFQF